MKHGPNKGNRKDTKCNRSMVVEKNAKLSERRRRANIAWEEEKIPENRKRKVAETFGSHRRRRRPGI